MPSDARGLAGQVVTAKKARNTATAAEVAAQKILMESLRDIQQRAKAKFQDKPKRSAYCINKENFGRDREGLEQDATNIINLGEADALRGLTPDKIAAAHAALAAWKQTDVAEGAKPKKPRAPSWASFRPKWTPSTPPATTSNGCRHLLARQRQNKRANPPVRSKFQRTNPLPDEIRISNQELQSGIRRNDLHRWSHCLFNEPYVFEDHQEKVVLATNGSQ